jgi:hypothetical protein
MSDGATRYSTSRKNKGIYYALIASIVMLSGLVIYGYREYENLSKQNRQFVDELGVLRGMTSIYPNMTDMLQQNRMLLQHNKALGDEVLDLREENSRLHVELIGKCETPVKTVAKVPP